ncbi:MAG: hypothetical protein KDA22_00820 [Phycisphaerales bacterium]|nr:hypothetical protein [Phycisphaerales bacterium]
MSQFGTPSRRAGDIDVFTGLLAAALIVLLTGVVLLAMRNIEHSGSNGQSGGVLTLVQ